MSELVLGNRQATVDALRLTEGLLPTTATPGLWAQLAYGYSLVDQTDDAQRLVRELNEIAANRYVDAGAWAWAFMSMDDYAEALNRLGEAAESPQLVTSPYPLYFIRLNFWSDPVLEQPDFIAAREKLAFR